MRALPVDVRYRCEGDVVEVETGGGGAGLVAILPNLSQALSLVD